jgi:hypothetical protein
LKHSCRAGVHGAGAIQEADGGTHPRDCDRDNDDREREVPDDPENSDAAGVGARSSKEAPAVGSGAYANAGDADHSVDVGEWSAIDHSAVPGLNDGPASDSEKSKCLSNGVKGPILGQGAGLGGEGM